MRRGLASAAVLLWICGRALPAQSTSGLRAGIVPSIDAPASAPATLRGATPLQDAVRFRKYAPLASAIVPGSGQALLGNDRFVVYLAVEALGWWMYAKDVSERSAREAQFKELAREVARAHFSPVFPDGNWAYYEWMRDYLESGAYSKSTAGAVVPETDVSTYNGAKWATLQSIYPTEAEALAEYEKAAIRPEFRWSWRNHQLEYDIYKRTTDKRNDANRAAVRDLLLIGANHVLSMFDAFTTARLQVDAGPDGRTRIGANLRW
jgi:hypothetical protein